MKIMICVTVFLLVYTTSFSQVRMSHANDTTLVHFRASGSQIGNVFNNPSVTFQNTPVIPVNFYAKHLSFFCRQELKMQQIHVPLTFRVGTMDQCNYLEQKPGYKIN